MRNPSKNNFEIMYGGVMPPNSLDLEKVVLGAMISMPKLIIDVKEILSPSEFYNINHAKICEAIYDISENNIPDIPMLAKYLAEKKTLDEIGGAYYLVQLTNSVINFTNIPSFCKKIKEDAIKRELAKVSHETLFAVYNNEEDVFLLLDRLDEMSLQINNQLARLKITQMSDIAMSVIDKINTKVELARQNIFDGNRVLTHIQEWDAINGQLFNGLYIIAGRPGMGKGVHLTELCCRMGKHYNIGIINGEMTNEQLMIRIGCNLMGIDNQLWKKDPKLITDEELDSVTDAMEKALELKLHIDQNLQITAIANKIKLWVTQKNVKCVLIDFLTLLEIDDNLSRYFTDVQKVNHILKVLAYICKKFNVPIILYVQMNRDILKRGTVKAPTLSDLKGSGSIEELAYQVCFLHRPEYYNDGNMPLVDENGENIEGLMWQIIAKHRDGRLDKIKYRAILKQSKLQSWEDNIPSFKNENEIPFF